MHPGWIALIVLACVCSAAAFGLWLRVVLPEHHLSAETKDAVKLATGLVATIAALVLSLLVSSARASLESVKAELMQNAARVLVLDRTLKEYGPESDDVRALLKASYASRVEELFSGRKAEHAKMDGKQSIAQDENIDAKLFALSPQNPTQQGLKSRAIEVNGQVELTRALMHIQEEEPMSLTLLAVLVCWMAVIFATFGLFAPLNATVVAALFVCAMSASGAILLILEMNTPFSGWLTISRAPLVETISRLGE
jgi:hypothetical protein